MQTSPILAKIEASMAREGLPEFRVGDTVRVHYRIVEDIGMPDSLREGTINVRVQPAASSGSGSAASRQQARDLTNKLYQAILMRNLDESGARGLAARLDGRPFTVTRVE